MSQKASILHHNGVSYVLPFIVITSLFALWGFANDITNPMVAAFQTVMELPARQASMIQFAFYGGYATMAIPAALFIRRYSYKSGILLGLSLYAVGAFLFIPAAAQQSFTFFCCSLYILTFGLAFLETTANPFILSLGSKETSTRRLNLAQAFNPMGSLCGMAVASLIVLPNLWSDRRDAAGKIIFGTLSEAEKADIRLHDLAIIRDPYVCIGIIVVIMLVVIAVMKMPKTQETEAKSSDASVRTTLSHLFHNRIYREGVIAQFFYVAAQIMVWTFIIQYADHLGINKATAQTYNIVAMSLFLCSRFLATMLMKYLNGRLLLSIFGIGAYQDHQILDFMDFISNTIMMPVVALLTCVFIGFVIKPQTIIDHVKTSSAFKGEKLFTVMIKYVAPVFVVAILIAYVMNTIGMIQL